MSSAYKEDGGHEDILKIGYSANENTLKKRDKYHLYRNPTIKTLAVIDGGTLTDVANLHRYFAKYRKYGNEWFSYSEEIIEFFRTHTTKESLSGLSIAISNAAQAKDNIRSKFLEVFKVGERYSNKDIKTLVENIYTELGLSSKKPKGTDIAEYFEIKPVLIIKDDEKINGQEILAIK